MRCQSNQQYGSNACTNALQAEMKDMQALFEQQQRRYTKEIKKLQRKVEELQRLYDKVVSETREYAAQGLQLVGECEELQASNAALMQDVQDVVSACLRQSIGAACAESMDRPTLAVLTPGAAKASSSIFDVLDGYQLNEAEFHAAPRAAMSSRGGQGHMCKVYLRGQWCVLKTYFNSVSRILEGGAASGAGEVAAMVLVHKGLISADCVLAPCAWFPEPVKDLAQVPGCPRGVSGPGVLLHLVSPLAWGDLMDVSARLAVPAQGTGRGSRSGAWVVDLRLVLRCSIKAFEALHGLHASGHVHCDVKPDNFLYTFGDEVKLGDLATVRPLPQGQASVSSGASASHLST